MKNFRSPIITRDLKKSMELQSKGISHIFKNVTDLEYLEKVENKSYFDKLEYDMKQLIHEGETLESIIQILKEQNEIIKSRYEPNKYYKNLTKRIKALIRLYELQLQKQSKKIADNKENSINQQKDFSHIAIKKGEKYEIKRNWKTFVIYALKDTLKEGYADSKIVEILLSKTDIKLSTVKSQYYKPKNEYNIQGLDGKKFSETLEFIEVNKNFFIREIVDNN